MCQPWILNDEPSELWTLMATESVSSFVPMNADSISESGMGDSPVSGELIVVRLPPLCEIAVVELDILRRWIRKLRNYEEIHIACTRYLLSDGIYSFLLARRNDGYGRI